MNRQRLLVITTALLAVIFIGKWILSGWGLITVHADAKPLSEVIRSIEKQAGATIRTNMEPSKTVTMHVDRVTLAEALEVLGAVSDGRCRLAYVFAGDNSALETGVNAWSAGPLPEDWKSIEVPLMGRGGNMEAVVADPRKDVWTVGEPAEKTLQGYLENAAVHVSAAFAFPAAFNPAVSKAPSTGEIRKAAAALASATGAKSREIIYLTGRPPGAPEGDDDEFRGPPGGGGGEGRRPNPELMRQRRLNEIGKLPASQQSAARAEFEEMDKVFAEVRDLPREERRAKMEEIFSRPEMQDRMDDRRLSRDELRTPEQRMKRYRKYVERKQEAQK